MSYKLRPYQQEVHDSTVNHMRETYKNGNFDPSYASVTVGGGKTILIAFLVKQIMQNKDNSVLVLARQGELISQNAEDAKAIGLKLSIFSASLNMKSTYYPVVYGTEGTVGRSLMTDFRDKTYTAILIDEGHHVDWEDCLKDSPESQYGKIIHHFRFNAKLQGKKPPLIVCYTGSPYRNNETIKGDFWKKELSDVSTYQLINLGFLVPPVFGFGDESHSYQNLEQFKPSESETADDFTAKQMAAMGREICKQKSITESIIEEVIERTKDRLGVLITCSSKKHCDQVAEFLPKGTWGVVTDSTTTKARKKILDDAKTGRIKYVLQIGCLSTGVNVPRWDVIVILRKIGSLTYLIQLTGRGLRTLKPEQIEDGLNKQDCLVLDYTDTFASMGHIFDDPIIQEAVVAKGKKEIEYQDCPECGTVNSEYAVRCIGRDESAEDGRCEYFFQSRVCVCGADNAPSARNCRKCDAILIDPTKHLVNKAYTEDDYKPVIRMNVGKNLGGNLLTVHYELASTIFVNGAEKPEVAKETLNPFAPDKFQKSKWWKFVTDHIQGNSTRRVFASLQSLDQMIDKKELLAVPTTITHRVNGKGFSIISRKNFN